MDIQRGKMRGIGVSGIRLLIYRRGDTRLIHKRRKNSDGRGRVSGCRKKKFRLVDVVVYMQQLGSFKGRNEDELC